LSALGVRPIDSSNGSQRLEAEGFDPEEDFFAEIIAAMAIRCDP
jgi:hypothetical protein